MSASTPTHAKLAETTRELAYEHAESEAVSGDAYTEPVHGKTVFYRRTLRPDGVRVEINTTTPEARPTFEWLAEITIEDKASDRYEHFLVRQDDVVETYGKTVLEVSETKAAGLLAELQELLS